LYSVFSILSLLLLSLTSPTLLPYTTLFRSQVNDKADMSYEKLLVAALRLHPDVFLIGEIRNEQTAAIAIKAALSGHLVLSTVHRSEEHTSELQSRFDLVCRLLLEKKNKRHA